MYHIEYFYTNQESTFESRLGNSLKIICIFKNPIFHLIDIRFIFEIYTFILQIEPFCHLKKMAFGQSEDSDFGPGTCDPKRNLQISFTD